MVNRALWDEHRQRGAVELVEDGPPLAGGRVLASAEVDDLEAGVLAVLGGKRYRVTIHLTEEPPPEVGRFHAHAITLLADLIATLRAAQAEVDRGE